ncbi:hypothetical protein [Halovivax limisalsi]|uniref:hypothetical protein n=1 Tax=Halovivax limisalsi TaxID=1453760 RepID=UPI001FFD14ED|nr:hypothetical protein [Halovivax limisalsi]
MSRDTPTEVRRRSILRGVAGSAAVMGGLGAISGTGAAEQARQQKQELLDPDRARTVVEAETVELRSELARRGILDSASIDQFTFEPQFDPEVTLSTDAETEGFDVAADIEEGTPTAHISVSKNTDRYDIAVYVRPGVDRSYAVVEDTRTDDRFAINPDTDSVKLESSPCPEDGETYCAEDCCASEGTYGYKKEMTVECFYEPQFGCICDTTASDCYDGCASGECGW